MKAYKAGKKYFKEAHIPIISVFLILILFSKCNITEPPINGKEITLKVEDVSCTEAWITLKTTTLQLPATVTLKQDNQTRSTINLIKADTLLYIDSLLPNTTYKFQVSSIQNQVSSNEVTTTTMDTTSHNITWQIFTFGEHQHSRLNDVAIIDANNIWVAGEIYLLDSAGQADSQPYGVALWNGQRWELKKLFYNTSIPVIPRGILVISPNEIYLASGSIFYWDGISSTTQLVYSRLNLSNPNGTIEKLWASSGSVVYGVGKVGSMVYYNEHSWQQIESGTDVNLYDVWGSNDGTIWTCGYSNDYGTTALLRYSGQSWETVYEGSSNNQNNGYYIGPISGVWGTGGIRIYMMNWSGLYIQANSNKLFLEKEIAKFSGVGNGIDGTDDNNIFVCGEGFVGHWNGVSYTEYPELYRDHRTFYSVSVKGKTVCAGGSDYNGFIYSQAVIALGKIN